MYSAILPNLICSRIAMDFYAIKPFAHTTLVGPLSNFNDLKTHALEKTVERINRYMNKGNDGIEIVLDRAHELEIESKESKETPTGAVSKLKRKATQPPLDEYETFIVNHCKQTKTTFNPTLHGLEIHTYEELDTFATLFQNDLEGLVKFKPIFFKCDNMGEPWKCIDLTGTEISVESSSDSDKEEEQQKEEQSSSTD